MKRLILIFAGILALTTKVHATGTPFPMFMPPSVSISSVTASGGLATVTITSPTSVGPYSLGYYNYISHIHIEMYAVSTLTGGATPVTCTTTALQSLAIKFPTAAATGTTTVVDMPLDNPIQGTIASNVVVTCPATSNVIWNIIVTYYQGQ